MACSGSLEATALWPALGLTLVKVAAFVLVMLVAGPRILPWVLQQVERTRSPEMFTLGVVAIAIGVAFGSSLLFGVSFALGAFFAGVVINESDAKHRVEKRLRPFQDAFAVLFFVAVGMLFDPEVLVAEPLRVLAVLAIILVGKTAAAICIVLVLGRQRATALKVSAALAQIGEFSFILAGMGVSLGLLPQAGLKSHCRWSIALYSAESLCFSPGQPSRFSLEARPRPPTRPAVPFYACRQEPGRNCHVSMTMIH